MVGSATMRTFGSWAARSAFWWSTRLGSPRTRRWRSTLETPTEVTRFCPIEYVGAGTWTLFLGDRNGVWTMDFDLYANRPIAVILDQIGMDPTCVFWGCTHHSETSTLYAAYHDVRLEIACPVFGGTSSLPHPGTLTCPGRSPAPRPVGWCRSVWLHGPTERRSSPFCTSGGPIEPDAPDPAIRTEPRWCSDASMSGRSVRDGKAARPQSGHCPGRNCTSEGGYLAYLLWRDATAWLAR